MKANEVVAGQEYIRTNGRIVIAQQDGYRIVALVISDPTGEHRPGKILEQPNWNHYSLHNAIDEKICACVWKRHPLYCKCSK